MAKSEKIKTTDCVFLIHTHLHWCHCFYYRSCVDSFVFCVWQKEKVSRKKYLFSWPPTVYLRLCYPATHLLEKVSTFLPCMHWYNTDVACKKKVSCDYLIFVEALSSHLNTNEKNKITSLKPWRISYNWYRHFDSWLIWVRKEGRNFITDFWRSNSFWCSSHPPWAPCFDKFMVVSVIVCCLIVIKVWCQHERLTQLSRSHGVWAQGLPDGSKGGERGM